jgi:hypothetical protein
MKHSTGSHVQWRHRTGTRAGFIEKVINNQTELDNYNKSNHTNYNISRHKETQFPCYIIKQEKNDMKLLKSNKQVSFVQGEEGLNKQQIIAKDKQIKGKKRSKHEEALQVEPKANKAAKSKTMHGTESIDKMIASKRQTRSKKKQKIQ